MRQTLSKGIIGIAIVALSVGCTGPNSLASRASTHRIDSNTYIVQAGDTIESVAYRYQLTSNDLVKMNPRVKHALYPGQPLRVRTGRRQITPQRSQRKRESKWDQSQHQPQYQPQHQPQHQPQYQPRRQTERTEVPASYREDSRRHSTAPVVVSAVPVREVPIREIPIINRENQDARQVREEIIQESIIPNNDTDHSLVELQSTVSRNGWIWPLSGEVVRDYAPGKVNGQGVDIAGLPGQEIRAAAGGTVIYAGRDLSNSGNLVIVRHTDNVLSTYSHAKNIYVAENEAVNSGDPIASLGANSSGESVLHFGVRKGGKPVDPMRFLPNR